MYCSKCGAKVVTSGFCSQCGIMLPDSTSNSDLEKKDRLDVLVKRLSRPGVHEVLSVVWLIGVLTFNIDWDDEIDFRWTKVISEFLSSGLIPVGIYWVIITIWGRDFVSEFLKSKK